ncbi:DUF4202 family protein [Candidatus Parcubacteria bacterium]|nr:DUF4202 family protein [Candidatus Parcubacteria bacterium]
MKPEKCAGSTALAGLWSQRVFNFQIMNLYKKVEQFVRESSPESGRHAFRTVFWMKKIYSQADEAMLIAAIAHDIERAFRKDKLEEIRCDKEGFLDKKHIDNHQEKSAEIIGNFLKKQGAEDDFINKVKMLVSKHEVGGSKEQNILKDADSISFFENNVDYFVGKLSIEIGKKEVRDKFDWMFERITSSRAKEIARPWHEDGIKKLEN